MLKLATAEFQNTRKVIFHFKEELDILEYRSSVIL